MDKAPDAFRTISEVADDLDIPQHVLRFWETRFTQIKPMKRSGGRRYYRPDDVDLLRGIRRLLYGEGYTIRGVQRILKENGIKSVQGLVDGHAAPSFAPTSAVAAVAPRVQAKRPVVEEDHEEEETEDEAERDDDIAEEAEDEADAEGEEEGDGEESDDEDGEVDDDEAEEEDDEEVVEATTPAVARRGPDLNTRRDTSMREELSARREPPMIAPAPRVEIARSQASVRAEPVMSRPAPAAPRPPRPLDRERLEAVLEELLAARQALDTAMKDG
ncbi:MerR family transcriptional regulator [Tardiphaga sp. P9-11]|uniref:MerR family transcriptional regulator n=1 Tax=Tardiphaga sp. P9-11 TaxID=2024614 RepID=UPI0011F16257|nr:MerR family transcriptional regulator [Tardiphaga sp. P9-11]KAA0076136.1 MerR family transcriptional regulator [Tardiphaga sp. P9-11]